MKPCLSTMIFWSYKMQIIDNYLDEELFSRISDFVLGSQNIPWFLQKDISGDGEEDTVYFTHLFHAENTIQSNHFKFVVEPITFMLGARAIVRVKGNLYPRTDELVYHKPHVDFDFPHQAAIFYLNSNDGYTVVDGEKVESVRNRLLKFDPSVEHQSTNCTDTPFRANININYFA